MKQKIDNKFKYTNRCRLCGETNLENSHIIPRSLVMNFRKNANFKLFSNIDGFCQDTVKDYMLCKNCERKFSDYENYYKKRVMPFIGSSENIYINNQIRYYVLSILWRVLCYHTEKHLFDYLPNNSLEICKKGLERTKTMLFNEEHEKIKKEKMQIIPLDWVDSKYKNSFGNNRIVRSQIIYDFMLGPIAYAIAHDTVFTWQINGLGLHNHDSFSLLNDEIYKNLYNPHPIVLQRIEEIIKDDHPTWFKDKAK